MSIISGQVIGSANTASYHVSRSLLWGEHKKTWMLCDILKAHGGDTLVRKTPLTNPCRNWLQNVCSRKNQFQFTSCNKYLTKSRSHKKYPMKANLLPTIHLTCLKHCSNSPEFHMFSTLIPFMPRHGCVQCHIGPLFTSSPGTYRGLIWLNPALIACLSYGLDV